MDSKLCWVCGDTFYKKQNESKNEWSRKKYCSRGCSLKRTSIKLQPRYFSNHPLTEEIKKKISESCKGRQPNFGCFKKGHIPWTKGKKFPEFSGSNHPRWKSRIQKICEVCKNVMELPQWDKARRFCGRACWAIGTTGEGSPVYKGEHSRKRLRYKIMRQREYRVWKAEILKRGKYTCQQCQSTEDLNVDHIKSFATIIKEYNVNSIEEAKQCEELWDQTNGRVLCINCHRKTNTYLKHLN